MRDLRLTDLNEVGGKEEDFKVALRFANNGAEIKFSLISLSCFWAFQL